MVFIFTGGDSDSLNLVSPPENDNLIFRIPRRHPGETCRRSLHINAYENKQSLVYKFNDENRNVKEIRFSYAAGQPDIVFHLLSEDDLIEPPVSKLSVTILSEFLEHLSEKWIDFMVDELHVLRAQLFEFACLDFLSTFEENLIESTFDIQRNDWDFLNNTFQYYEREILKFTPKLRAYANLMKTEGFEPKQRILNLLEERFREHFEKRNNAKTATLHETTLFMSKQVNWYAGLEKENAKRLAEIMIFCDEKWLQARMKSAQENDAKYGLQAEELSKELLEFLDVQIIHGDNLDGEAST